MYLSAISGEEREQAGYSAKRVMGVRMPCSQYLLALKPTPRVIAGFTVHDGQMPTLYEGFVSEITEYLYSYDGRIYVTEREGVLWGIVPATFFAASLALVLKFEMTAGAVLRLLDDSEYRDLFTLAPTIRARKAKMSRSVSESAEDFEDFFGRLKRCLFDVAPSESLCDTDSVIRALEDVCVNASLLVGCPVKFFEGETRCEKISGAGELDLVTFGAFLITVMMLAREYSADRGIRISFEALSQNMAAVVELDVGDSDCAEVISFWENISAERLMPFGFVACGQTLRIGFQPYRRELSYLGLKQKTDWNF